MITETENAHKTVQNNWKEYTLQYQYVDEYVKIIKKLNTAF